MFAAESLTILLPNMCIKKKMTYFPARMVSMLKKLPAIMFSSDLNERVNYIYFKCINTYTFIGSIYIYSFSVSCR